MLAFTKHDWVHSELNHHDCDGLAAYLFCYQFSTPSTPGNPRSVPSAPSP
jgi:hypothetical protein